MYLSEKDILSKFVLIEQYLKKDTHCFYVPSSTFNTIDVIPIQKEATKMLKFVGLNHHVACVTFTSTGEHEGGNIELDNSDNVFIEINRDIRNDINKVLAVMAHEICHKLLFVNGLYLRGEDNEILTDLTTVYVGFGKLSLNGCYKEYETESYKWDVGENKKIKTKHTETVFWNL